MRAYEFITENDQEHRAQLAQTGFWGKQGAGCILFAKDTGRFCLAHRSQQVEEPGTWGTWGGAIDGNEDPAKACLRELQEESGYTGRAKLVPLYVFSHSSGFRYYNFLAIVEKEFTPRLDWETQGYDWFTLDDLPQPLHKGMVSLFNDQSSVRTLQKYAGTPLSEGWKQNIAALGAAGAMALGGVSMFKNQNNQPVEEPVATTQQAPALNLPRPAQMLMKMAEASGIVGTELAQMLAQTSHETMDFKTLRELGSPKYFKKYDIRHNPRLAKILGNIKPGDGEKYKGRGFLQITGRGNYKQLGELMQLPLEEQPELLERPDIAAKASIIYWQNRVQPHVNDFNDTSAVTRRINAGKKGLEDRATRFKEYAKSLGHTGH
jgi:predicted chitinase/8-oxo-dGTP pyrophosphatase MutT (NUDIX family)